MDCSRLWGQDTGVHDADFLQNEGGSDPGLPPDDHEAQFWNNLDDQKPGVNAEKVSPAVVLQALA